MADRTIVTRLRAEIADFKSKMGEAAKTGEDAAKRIGGAIDKNSAHINTLSNQAGLLGAAMVAAAGVAVKAFADFDEGMSAVEAATHESAEGMNLLRAAALDAGARTKYSATEAAGAVENLAKAGVSTADILGGALDGALDLAASGNMDVADAAEIAASALTQFNLKGDKTSHVADLLAAGAGKAQGEVGDLGAAMNQSGLVANQMGLSIEETVGSLTAFAKAGLVGSDAGTSFRAMLLRLANPTGESAKLMDELNLSFYDAQGEFIGMEGVAGQLQDRLGDLTQEQRNAALATIFGQDAIRAASILYENGAQGIADWTAKVDDSGYAAETAAIRMNNLKGDLEQLGGAGETALIGLGEAGNGPLRDMVQWATNVVNAFAGLPDAVQGGTLAIVGGGGLALLGVAGLGKLVTAVNDAKNALSAMGVTAKGAGLAVGVAGAALGVAAIALTAWAQNAAEAKARTEELQSTLDEFGNVTGDTLSEINKALSENRNNWAETTLQGKQAESLIDMAERYGLAVEDLQGYILGEAEATERVNAATDAYISSHSGSASTTQAAKAEVSELTGALDSEASALTGAEKAAAQKAIADEAAGVASDGMTESTEAATDAMAAQIPTLEDLISAQREAAGIVATVMEAQSAFQAAIDDATAAIEENGATLDLNTEAGRANQAALLDIQSSTWDLIESMQANGATQEELQAQMQVSRDAFLTAAGAMGMGADEANRLADEMGLIPAKVNVPVTVDTSGAQRDVESLKAILRGIPDVVITSSMRDAGGYYANRAAGGIVYGPGTATSDSINARLSNGEYVVKASAVQQYGKSFFDGLNAQRFATGGLVGSGAASRGAAGSAAGPVDLSSSTIASIARAIAARPSILDGRVVSRSVSEQIGDAWR